MPGRGSRHCLHFLIFIVVPSATPAPDAKEGENAPEDSANPNKCATNWLQISQTMIRRAFRRTIIRNAHEVRRHRSILTLNKERRSSAPQDKRARCDGRSPYFC